MFFIENNVAWQEYFDKIYIFDDVNCEAYILEDVSAFIWKVLEKHQTYDQILAALFKQYRTIDSIVLKKIWTSF